MDILFTSVAVAVGLLTLTGMFVMIRKSLQTHGVIINRDTDMGERLSITLNFTGLDSKKAMQEKLDQAFELTDARKKFTHDRMQKLYEETVRQQQAEAAAESAEASKVSKLKK